MSLVARGEGEDEKDFLFPLDPKEGLLPLETKLKLKRFFCKTFGHRDVLVERVEDGIARCCCGYCFSYFKRPGSNAEDPNYIDPKILKEVYY